MSLLNGLTFTSLTGNCFDADEMNKQWFQKATWKYDEVNVYLDQVDEHWAQQK